MTTEPWSTPPVDAVANVPPQVMGAQRLTRTTSVEVEAIATARSDDRGARIAALWAHAETSGAPLIDRCGGGRCVITFLWRGGDDVADVYLVANKISDATTFEDCRFARVDGTDVWSLTLEMPSDWRASYALAVVPVAPPDDPPPEALAAQRRRSLAAAAPQDRPALERWFDALRFARPDPLARDQLDDQLSVVALPDAPGEPRVGAAAVPTTTTTWRQPAGHGVAARDITVHVPRHTNHRPWPVVLLLDGQEWLDVPFPPVIEDAINTGALPPLLTVMVPSIDVSTRVADLTCNTGFLSFLVDDVLDEVARRWSITRDPQRVVIAGKSLGGLTALWAACARPDRVANAVVQSGSFWWPNDPTGPEWLTDRLRTAPPPVGAVYVEVGSYEWVLLEPTRRLRDVLRQRDVELTYHEFTGGHDRACWRSSLLDGLQAVTADWPHDGAAASN